MLKAYLRNSATFAPDVGTGGGAAGTGTQNPPTGHEKGGQIDPNTKPNGTGGDGKETPIKVENFLDDNASLWENPKIEVDPVKEAAQNTAAQERQRNTHTNLKNYVDNLDFGIEIPKEKIAEIFENKDPTAMLDVMNNGIKSAVQQTILAVTKMIKGSHEELRREMDDAAKMRYNANEAEKTLFEAVPFAKKEAIRPVATAIKAAFIKKGKSDSEANDMVKAFFKHTMEISADDLGLEVAPKGRPGEGGRGRRTQQAEPDWGAILRGQEGEDA